MNKIDFTFAIEEIAKLLKAEDLLNLLDAKKNQPITPMMLQSWAIASKDGYTLSMSDPVLRDFMKQLAAEHFYESNLYQSLIIALSSNSQQKIGPKEAYGIRSLNEFIPFIISVVRLKNLVKEILLDPKASISSSTQHSDYRSEDFGNMIIQFPYSELNLELLIKVFASIEKIIEELIFVIGKIEVIDYSMDKVVVNYFDSGSPLQININFNDSKIGKYFWSFLKDVLVMKQQKEKLELENIEKRIDLIAKINALEEGGEVKHEDMQHLKVKVLKTANSVQKLSMYPKGLLVAESNPEIMEALPPKPEALPGPISDNGEKK